jgi:hypothetical protein
LFVSLGIGSSGFAADAQEAANTAANPKAKEILKYFQSLESQADKHLISGQFVNIWRLGRFAPDEPNP